MVRGPRFPIDGVVYRSSDEQAKLLASGAWLDTTVGDLIRATARAHPDKVYLHAGGCEVTFAELDRRSEGLAASLIEQGLRPGDRAIFQIGIAAETVIALFGCYKAGVVPVCTLPQYRDIEIGQLTEMSAAKAYFVQADFSPNFDLVAFARRMGAAHPTLKTFIVARGAAPADMLAFDTLCDAPDAAASAKVVTVGIDPGDVLTFQLSGGSTGVPKIIPRMHGEYLAQARGWARMHQYGPDEICIWPLPIIHNAGLLLVVLGSLLNASAILLQEKFDPVAFLDAIEKHRVTWAGSIGPIAPRLLDYPDIARHDLSSLRMFVAMDRADAIEAHVGVVTMNLYGITEGLLMSTSPTDSPAARHWTNGRSSSGDFDEIRVLAFDSETPVPAGQQGELCFRGPHSLRAYYNADPEVNAASFTSDGFVRTSDIVREVVIAGVSHYVFLGRVKDNISRGNEKFAAEEVEKLIVQHPAVLDAKVVAMPDRYLGEKACAFIIPRPGETCPDVKGLGAFLVDQGLAKFKLPERIEAVTEFPVTRVGKVDKMAMRALVKDKIQGETGG